MSPDSGEKVHPPVGIAAILAVPVLLAVIHLLFPRSLKELFAFSHDSFAVYTLFTAAYIHAGQSHLVGNIAGYLLTTLYAYMLCTAVDERRWFWRTFVAFLLLLPVLVNLSSYIAFSTWHPSASPVSRGFSGVVAGFGGFLLAALAVYVRSRYSNSLGNAVGISTFLVLMAIIDYIYGGGVRFEVVALVAGGIVAQIWSHIWQSELTFAALDSQRVVVDAVAVTLVLAVLGYVVISMFPADIVQNGSATNIIAHGMGFLLGVGVSVVTNLETRNRVESR